MTIKLIILIVIAVVAVITKLSNQSNWLNDAQHKNETRFEYLNRNVIEASEARKNKEQREKNRKNHNPDINKRTWYPTGWIFNEETQLWEPPDYMEEDAKKWEWDEDKLIWIDKEREARKERYAAFRKSQGKPPTYEEWKAAKLAAENKEHPEQ